MVLEYLQKYSSIASQEKAEEYIYLHCGIKGLQISYGFSAAFVILRSLFRKRRNLKLSASTPMRKIYIFSSILGVALSETMTYYL